MNALFENFVYFLFDEGWANIVLLLMLSAARPLALLYGFTGFNWALGTARLARAALAVALSLPLALITLPQIRMVIADATTIDILYILIKEVVVGLALGLMASLPFFAMKYAGAITDQFRGESDSGLHAPDGGTITTFGMTYMVIAFYIFVDSGGLFHLFGALFESYVIWPLIAPLPQPSLASIDFVTRAIMNSLWLAIWVAAPLLTLLFVIEFSVSIAARLGRQFNFYNLAFPLKNVATILSLPILAAYIAMFDRELVADILNGVRLIEVFQP